MRFALFLGLLFSPSSLLVQAGSLGRVYISDVTEPEFLVGFRRLWGRVIEIATELGDNQPIQLDNPQVLLKPESVSDESLELMREHIMTSDRNYISYLLTPAETRDGLLDGAGLLQYSRILSEMVDLNDIYTQYWNEIIPDRIKGAATRLNRFMSRNNQGEESANLIEGLTVISESIPSLAKSFGFWVARRYMERSIPNLDACLMSLILSIRHVLTNDIDVTRFVDLRQILLSPSVGIDITIFPTRFQELFDHGVVGYFTNSPLVLKGRMVSGIVSLSPRQSQDDFELVKAVMNRAGPSMQKMMQMFGNEVQNDRLRILLDELKDAIQPMSDSERHKLVSHLFPNGIGRPAPYQLSRVLHYPDALEAFKDVGPIVQPHDPDAGQLFVERETFVRLISLDKRVGAASIGEGWLATVQVAKRGPGDVLVENAPSQMFLKLKRWKIDRLMNAEIDALSDITERFPELANLIRELTNDLREELDWELEFANQANGYFLMDYNARVKRSKGNIKYDGLFVPRPVALIQNQDAAAILMPLAAGESLAKVITNGLLKEDNACSVVKLWNRFMQQWISRLMQHGGKGHGDPHAGNVLVGFHPYGSLSWLTILDWGNTITITTRVQRELHNLVVAVFWDDSARVADALGRTLENKHEPYWAEFKSRCRGIFDAVKDIKLKRWKRNFFGVGRSQQAEIQRLQSHSLNRVAEDNFAEDEEEFYDAPEELADIDEEVPILERQVSNESDDVSSENSGDRFSITSDSVKAQKLALANWDYKERIMETLDNIMAVAIELGIPIPEGTASIFRARRFLENTLTELRRDPAVVAAQCAVPSAAVVFCDGLLSVTGIISSARKTGIARAVKSAVNYFKPPSRKYINLDRPSSL